MVENIEPYIIIPACPPTTVKPNYLHFDYANVMLLQRVIAPYGDSQKIVVGILREHDFKYQARTFISKLCPNVNVVVLDELTRGPAETVHQILTVAGIYDSPILIKDCDSFFDHSAGTGNYVCVSCISDHDVLTKIQSKSFVRYNVQGIVTDIVEKAVVSDTFSTGAYHFESARLFMECYQTLGNNAYVSHVISAAINMGHTFTIMPVANYVDVGTEEEWHEYNDGHPVIFCDIDGTIIEAQKRFGKNSYDDEPEPLIDNVSRLLELQRQGAQFIFVTSRPKEYLVRTEAVLLNLGFKGFTLVAGLNNSRRILINDYNEANPYPRARAINIQRNADNLRDFI